jgi:hypothetical protein
MSIDAELLIEIETKRAELSGAPTKTILQELMKDAARTCSPEFASVAGTTAALAYPYREFMPNAAAAFEFCERLLTSIERSAPGKDIVSSTSELVSGWGAKPRVIKLPTAAEARRLRVITGTLPGLLPPSQSGKWGIASKPDDAWWLLWQDACGLTAPKIAAGLERRNRRAPKLVKRGQVWRIRDKLYDMLAATIDDAARLSRAA